MDELVPVEEAARVLNDALRAAREASSRYRGLMRRSRYLATREYVLRESAKEGGPCARLCGRRARPGRVDCLECSEKKKRLTMEARKRRRDDE